MTDDQIIEIDDLKMSKLCADCVQESYLRNEICSANQMGTCSYCESYTNYYSLEQLSERIETVFEEHYFRTSDQPTSIQLSMLANRDSTYQWEREGEPVVYAIMNAADIPEEAAADVQKILEDKNDDWDAGGEETEFSSDSHYEERETDDAHWQLKWQQFEQSVKTEARFFSRAASKWLESVFDGIDTLQAQDGRSLIVDAGPNTNIEAVFRARSFQSDERLLEALARPDLHLGPPPSAGASAGRMNSHGISVYYGANNPRVAIAEVRPPVGSRVTVARFDIIKPIRLLDLTALRDVTTKGSIFDPNFNDCLKRMMFLRNLCRRITIPVMPNDEMFDYLPTQVIAEFLAAKRSTAVDGIMFPSAQGADESLNFVLFHKSARVDEIELPEGTEVKASLRQIYEDDAEIEYSVVEEVPSQEKSEKNRRSYVSQSTRTNSGGAIPDFDSREPTLQIDLNSVRVHQIETVKFGTSEYPVNRHRWEKIDPDF